MSGLAPAAVTVPLNDKSQKSSNYRDYEITINFKDAPEVTNNDRTSSSFPDDPNCYDRFKLRFSKLRGQKTSLHILHWNSQCIYTAERHRFEISISQQCMTKDGLTAATQFSKTLELKCHRWMVITQFPCEITDAIILTVKVKIPIRTKTLTFHTLEEEEEFRDFTLEGTNGAHCKIHRMVLAAHSTVFRRRLKGDRGSSMRLKADIVTLNEFVEYMYCGQQPRSNLTQLLKLAREFGMRDLVSKCIAGLLESLTVYNALQMMNFASTNNCPSLLFAITFFIKNNCEEVVTENLKYMMNGKKENEREPPLDFKFDISCNETFIGKMQIEKIKL